MTEFQSDQIFIVTGASSGIGQGVAWSLNECGATVVGIARRENKLYETKEKSKHPDCFHIETKDLTTDVQDLPKYVTSLREKYGKFRGMAYCAGVSVPMSLKGLTIEETQRMFQINYFAPLFMTKGVVDKRNNTGKGTSVLAVSSIAALTSPSGLTAYAGSKAALAASLRVISREVAPLGVRINTVSPGLTETPMVDEQAKNTLLESYSFGIGQVEDVANTIVFLLSDKAKWITGQDYIVDCGSF